jgi:GTP-binding protein
VQYVAALRQGFLQAAPRFAAPSWADDMAAAAAASLSGVLSLLRVDGSPLARLPARARRGPPPAAARPPKAPPAPPPPSISRLRRALLEGSARGWQPADSAAAAVDASDDEEYGSDEELDGVEVQWVTPEAEEAAAAAAEASAEGSDGEEWYDDDDDGGSYAGYEKPEKRRVAGKRLPAEVRCFDTARIFVKGGDGGRGCVAFRREKYVPRGGPSGGNGGNGGAVWVEADAALTSLAAFRRQVHFRADGGTPGQGSDCHGAGASDAVVRVPPGTILRERGAPAGAPPLAEVLAHGDRALLAAGGRGGRGNLAFKSARNSAPTLAELGEPGAERWLDLELRLVADAGIVGCPNAGKSTLLSVLSAARPRVADYPFTTLTPNLGVAELDFRTTVFADVPGLLEGAAAGVGLGHQFLRHCQRCRVLVHVIDGSSPDPLGDYDAVRLELGLFSPELAAKPALVAYNKVDLPDSADYEGEVREGLAARGVAPADVLAVSAATGRGAAELVRAVRALLDALPAEEPRAAEAAPPAAAPSAPGGDVRVAMARRGARFGDFSVKAEGDGRRAWAVRGEALERFAAMTDWSYYESARRFARALDAAGVTAALKAAGARVGDTVVIGGMEFEHGDAAAGDDGALYEKWNTARRAAGQANRGSARWPRGKPGSMQE